MSHPNPFYRWCLLVALACGAGACASRPGGSTHSLDRSFTQTFATASTEVVFAAVQQALRDEDFEIVSLDDDRYTLIANLNPPARHQPVAAPARRPGTSWVRDGLDARELTSKLAARVEAEGTDQVRVELSIRSLPNAQQLSLPAARESIQRSMSELFEKIEFRLKIEEAFRGLTPAHRHADSF